MYLCCIYNAYKLLAYQASCVKYIFAQGELSSFLPTHIYTTVCEAISNGIMHSPSPPNKLCLYSETCL